MKLALLGLLAASTAAAAPCDRPALLPAAVPLLPCPARAAPAACTAHCPEHGEYLSLYYAEPPKQLATAWGGTLRAAGWAVRASDITLDPDRPGEPRRRAHRVIAVKHGARIDSVAMILGKETQLSITYAPR